MAIASKPGNRADAGRRGPLAVSPYNAANLVTLLRLALVPPALLFIAQEAYTIALLFILAAGISDAVDGYLARRFACRTALGSFLDPLADKVLLTGTYLAMASTGAVPVFLAALVALRDVLLVAGAVRLHKRLASIRPLPIGKLNTGLQVVLVLAALLEHAGLLNLAWLIAPLVPVVALSTVASGLAYLWKSRRLLGLRLGFGGGKRR